MTAGISLDRIRVSAPGDRAGWSAGVTAAVRFLSTPEAADKLRSILKDRGCATMPEIVHGADGIVEAATVSTADTVVTGIVGAAGHPYAFRSMTGRHNVNQPPGGWPSIGSIISKVQALPARRSRPLSVYSPK